MARKPTKAEQIASKFQSVYKSLFKQDNRKQVEKDLTLLRRSYIRRVEAFQRRNLISHAQIALESSMPQGKQKKLSEMTHNQLILEYARYAKFFTDETSTVEGIKRINREQDIRIFGADKRGRPNRTMTSQERERYWSLYEEYQNMHPTASSRYGSESVQQQLADAIFSLGDPSQNLVSFLDSVEQKLHQQYITENLRSMPNVYSGRGNTF